MLPKMEFCIIHNLIILKNDNSDECIIIFNLYICTQKSALKLKQREFGEYGG